MILSLFLSPPPSLLNSPLPPVLPLQGAPHLGKKLYIDLRNVSFKRKYKHGGFRSIAYRKEQRTEKSLFTYRNSLLPGSEEC